MARMIEGMSRKTWVSSSGTYNVRASELAHEKKLKMLQCCVVFLDDSQHLFEIEKRAKGQVMLDLVFHHLELTEKDYFGLQFCDPGITPNPVYPNETMRWLDPLKSVKKQLGAGMPYTLYLRVKFYVSDPSKLQEEYTRYHFFLQLRKDIHTNRLVVPPSTACLLASYCVQSELGDYNCEEHVGNYVSELQILSNQCPELEKKICELHKLHRGQTPADAEYHFLDHVKRLEMYGVDLHRAKDSQDKNIQLGVTSTGLVVFQNSVKINTFSWAKIVKISFKRRQFFMQLRREAETYDSVLGFNLQSYRSCKNLWKSCVEHHTFFRLDTPRPPSRRFLFSLGSKFRYSGRTEYQTVEETRRRARLERTFIRSPSRKNLHQTLPQVSSSSDNRLKPEKACRAVNGTSAPPSTARHYDSFNNKVQSLAQTPRRAWAEGTVSDDEGGFLERVERSEDQTDRSQPFTPSISAKVFSYVDEDTDSDKHEYESQNYIDSNRTNDVLNEDLNGHGLVTIRMKPDEQGRFGFNVKGGIDQSMPIIVTRVAPNTPADKCYPRLNEGDQVFLINGRDVSQHNHEQVVSFIRASRESHSGELVLTVRPNVYVCEEIEEPAFQYVPDVLHVSPFIAKADALSESMLLLGEALDSGSLTTQFEQLYRKKPGLVMNESKKAENLAKNRYRDISPYDCTLVRLDSSRTGDYINANYVNMEIQGVGLINRYIAAQGPLPNTCEDFWTMVWEAESHLVVMLTTVIERGRVKCHQYWPSIYESLTFGRLKLTCVKEEEDKSFAFREFQLLDTETDEERHITHMQYLAWPDHGVPEDSRDFLDFIQHVRQTRAGLVEPVVVHCSAGIGRTGVLILMETALHLIEANEPVYPLDIVRTMRDQRAMMIQTASQYRFVCQAIHKVYCDGEVAPLAEFKR